MQMMGTAVKSNLASAQRPAPRAIVLGLLLLCAAVGMASQDQSKTIRVQSLGVADNLYLLSGGGGNSLALVTDDGVVLVDSKLAGWGPAILHAVQALTDRPVTTIINTHTHGDHTGGNVELPSATRIVAHENTKTHMQSLPPFGGAGSRGLPSETFRDKVSLLDGIDRIDVYYFGAGHTNGDAVVVFPGKNIAHLGDLFPSKSAPVIDTARGGSGVAYPDTLAKVVAALDGQITRIMTGHEPPPPGSPIKVMTSLNDLKEFTDFTRAFLEAVRAAKASGASAPDAAKSLALPERFKAYDLRRAAENVEKIYGELR